MNWKNEVFENFKLYAVTDIQGSAADVLFKVEAAYRGGADIVQLRAKKLPDGELLQLAVKMRRIADRFHKLFFVNDRPGIALAAGADGVHLGQDDLPVEAVRSLFKKSGSGMWIGKSTHTLNQALAAQQEGPDYVGVGPVFATPTKPDYPAAGLDFIRQGALHLKIPFTAIGGIDLSNVDQVLAAGARRIAVVRAIFSAKDSYEATRKLRDKMENFCNV